MTVVRPELQFGVARLNGEDVVEGFEEKPRFEGWINGGFFCFEPGVLDYLDESRCWSANRSSAWPPTASCGRTATRVSGTAWTPTRMRSCSTIYGRPTGRPEGTAQVAPKTAFVTRTGTTALTLSEEIRQRFDEFSRSQKDVGQYIVDHLEEAAFHTAEELARRANTSSSTVVRFAQALGFEGFPELQAAARDEYRRARENGASTADLTTQPLFPIDQTEFETALAADHANMAETARKVDRDEVTAAVDLISRAERIVLCGTDQMAFFASYLRHLLMLLDLRAEVVASPSQEGLAKLGRIDDKTVMVGFSAGRPHPLVVRAMKLARNRRAATIAIADATLSEVAKLADHKLYYSSNSPAYVRSHSALLALIQALAYGVYALDESAYADRIKAFRLK